MCPERDSSLQLPLYFPPTSFKFETKPDLYYRAIILIIVIPWSEDSNPDIFACQVLQLSCSAPAILADYSWWLSHRNNIWARRESVEKLSSRWVNSSCGSKWNALIRSGVQRGINAVAREGHWSRSSHSPFPPFILFSFTSNNNQHIFSSPHWLSRPHYRKT
jgi:hypothetical protein